MYVIILIGIRVVEGMALFHFIGHIVNYVIWRVVHMINDQNKGNNQSFEYS